MKTIIKNWSIAFAAALPIVALLYMAAHPLGQWLPRQLWFANLILP